MRTANDAGLECLCVVDACAPVDPAVTPSAVSMIEMSGGIFGAVGTTGSVLSALSALSVPSPMGDQPAAPCRTEEASP
jgi:nicotinamidase-related amidase